MVISVSFAVRQPASLPCEGSASGDEFLLRLPELLPFLAKRISSPATSPHFLILPFAAVCTCTCTPTQGLLRLARLQAPLAGII